MKKRGAVREILVKGLAGGDRKNWNHNNFVSKRGTLYVRESVLSSRIFG